MMKIYWITLITIFGLCPQFLFSQAALQEISRIYFPIGNAVGFSQETGDINGDGTNDVVMAYADWLNTGNTQVLIYHSLPDSNSVPDQIIPIPDIDYVGWFGSYFTCGGDLNGDGINDLVISSIGTGIAQTGAVHIYYGGETLSSQPDLTLYGINYGTSNIWYLGFGAPIYSCYDYNNDGYDDLIVGASGSVVSGCGQVFVFSGGEQLSTTCALHISGTQDYEHLGNPAAGDINGDGYDDLIILRHTNVTSSEDFDMTLDVYAGGDTLSNVPVFETVIGHSPNEATVSRLLADGDLNGDGYNDILMSFYSYPNPVYYVKVIYGREGFDSLSVQQFSYPSEHIYKSICYCDLDYDNYSDFCAMRLNSNQSGSFMTYKQTSPMLELSYDTINTCDIPYARYGNGVLLGDINHDGYQEFFVCTERDNASLSNYATILSENCVGTEEAILPKPDSKIQYFPNPFRDRLNVKFLNKRHNNHYQIDIYDIKGRKVYSRSKLRTDEFSWTPAKDCKVPISSGIYLMQITENNRPMSTSKIIYTK